MAQHGDEGMKALSAHFDQKLHDLYEQIVREAPGYPPRLSSPCSTNSGEWKPRGDSTRT